MLHKNKGPVMTMGGWLKRYLHAPGTPYRYAIGPLPTAGAEKMLFQRPQRDPAYQVQGPFMTPSCQVGTRITQPQKWSIQTVLLAGIPATTGTFDLSGMVNIDYRPFESMPYSGE